MAAARYRREMDQRVSDSRRTIDGCTVREIVYPAIGVYESRRSQKKITIDQEIPPPFERTTDMIVILYILPD